MTSIYVYMYYKSQRLNQNSSFKWVLEPSGTHRVNRVTDRRICACAAVATRGNSRGVVREWKSDERRKEKKRKRGETGSRNHPGGFHWGSSLPHTSYAALATVAPSQGSASRPLMALVTVQRSPTPSTSSSPCVSVRTGSMDSSHAPTGTTTATKRLFVRKISL